MATTSAVPKMLPACPSKAPGPPDTTPKLPKPKFRLHINDLRHPASKFFITLIPDLTFTLETALASIIQNLYTTPAQSPDPTSPRKPRPSFVPSIPATRSVTILLRDIGGVAYTTGKELDDAHKEIHISLSYINHCRSKVDPLAELVGVLTHELVHCYQHSTPLSDESSDSAAPYPPGGLIEGVADFVRLKAGLEPPHWSRPKSAKERASKWDEGYQHTAYFLAWLEDSRVGKGAVGMLNDRLLRVGYIGEDEREDQTRSTKQSFWRGLFGIGIDELWEEYGKYLDSPDGEGRNGGNWEDEIVNAVHQ